VIVGGIKSIGNVAEKVVPLMCGIYLLAALGVILANIELLPEAVGIIFAEAFTPAAGMGGLIGVFIQGVKRAAFGSEAGVGSAAIAHSAAKTDEPVREGIVALLEPFIDTIVVCFMTGMVIVISGVYADPETAALNGVELTSAAFGQTFEFFPVVLSVAVFLFAFSTMISWSYYGERCWTFLFGHTQTLSYRIIFLVFVVIGCSTSLGNVTDFSDIMILSMAFPNIIGVVLLSGKLKDALDVYWRKYKNDEFKIYT
ncbi:MAG: alanine:cation symporter family protein, partial [Myxococcota bacterium]